MIREINVIPKTREKSILLFQHADLAALPNPRIVPLFGANGSGKTTLILAIRDTICDMVRRQNPRGSASDSVLESLLAPAYTRGRKALDLVIDDVPTELYMYRNSEDNLRYKQWSYRDSFNPGALAAKRNAQALSEGQSVVYSAFGLFDVLRERDRETDAVVLLDELDSGMSLDNLDLAYTQIREITEQNPRIQFFVSFNGSYILRFFPDVLSLYNGKPIRLETEDDMLKALRGGSVRLNRKRKDKNGEYRIFD